MTWTDLPSVTRIPSKVHPVTVAAPHSGRCRRFLRIAISLEMLPDLILTPGWVRAQIGSGENAGQILIDQGVQDTAKYPKHKIYVLGDHKNRLRINLPLPETVGDTAYPATQVDYDYKEKASWLEITLPSWAQSPEAAAKPVSLPPSQATRRIDITENADRTVTMVETPIDRPKSAIPAPVQKSATPQPQTKPAVSPSFKPPSRTEIMHRVSKVGGGGASGGAFAVAPALRPGRHRDTE